jgi:hypothetical protein
LGVRPVICMGRPEKDKILTKICSTLWLFNSSPWYRWP